MKSLTTEEANRVLLQSLKKTKKRTFNETGICFDGDVWAFPNNHKIFIGVNDYDMNDSTCFFVKRAMFRHELRQKINNNRIVLGVGSTLLLFCVLFGVRACKLLNKSSVKNKTEYTVKSGQKSPSAVKFIYNRQR